MPTINSVLSDNNKSPGDVTDIEFRGADGYTSDTYGTVTYSDLDTGKYYAYGSSTGTAVIPILATSYRSNKNDGSWSSWSSLSCIRDFFGQQDKSDATMEFWGKYINKIVIKVN